MLPYIATAYSPNDVALISSCGNAVTYEELVAEANQWASKVAHPQKQLIFLYIPRSKQGVACLLGLLHSNHAVALLDPSLNPPARQKLEELYQPWACVAPDESDSIQITISNTHQRNEISPIHPDVSLMLSTSGSTGSPKFAKLSRSAVLANARDIVEVLKIDKSDRGLAHLDFHYSYGLSILTTHLSVGASLAFPAGKFTDRNFWDDLRKLEATHVPGVPYHYQMMTRLGIQRLKIPSVVVMTQAGGRLALDLQKQVHQYMDSIGGRFYVMYGQTEAAPRMSTLSHDDFVEKPGSVGPALPSGEFIIRSENNSTCAANEVGEVTFEGPNVMLGYAHSASDLSKGDENGGVLRTGDMGFLDENGFLTINGRASRMGKVFGWRINLDELEKALEPLGCAAVLQKDEDIVVVNLVDTKPDAEKVRSFLVEQFALPESVYAFAEVNEIPKNKRDKTDYAALAGLI